jgi:hypothetical protein
MQETHWNDSGQAPEPMTREQITSELARLQSANPGIVNEETPDHAAIQKRIAELKKRLETTK